jgi:hypothetical protein
MLTFFILLCIPSIQLGASYWGSVATASTVLVLWKWYRPALKAALTNVPLMLVVACMFLSLFSYPSNEPLQDLMRIVREGLFFFFMTSQVAAFQNSRMNIDVIALQKPLFVLCLFLMIFVFMQEMSYARGTYFGVPTSWFSIESRTLPDELILYWTGGRPSGPYSEPSYLSFILISLVLMSLPLVRRSRVAIACLITIFVTGLATRSLAFPLALVLVLSPLALPAKLMDKIKIGVGASLVAIVALLTSDVGEVLSRLGAGINTMEDYSFSVRFLVPALALPRFLLTYPFGVPFYNLDAAGAPFVPGGIASDIFHNGLLNFIFEYGIFGFVMVLMMLKAARDVTARCYLVAASMFNGAFLSPDKFAVIVFSLAVYYSARKFVENNPPSAAGAVWPGRSKWWRAAQSTAPAKASSTLNIVSRPRSGSL